MNMQSLYDTDKNIEDMYLSELKNMLYSKKPIDPKIKEYISYNINTKIKDSIAIKKENITQEIESDNIYELTESDDIDSETNDDYKQDIKKLYERKNKKEENERFTQTSKKLFDRMFSEAQVINNSYRNNNQKISRPFVNENNTKKLGERKNIRY